MASPFDVPNYSAVWGSFIGHEADQWNRIKAQEIEDTYKARTQLMMEDKWNADKQVQDLLFGEQQKEIANQPVFAEFISSLSTQKPEDIINGKGNEIMQGVIAEAGRKGISLTGKTLDAMTKANLGMQNQAGVELLQRQKIGQANNALKMEYEANEYGVPMMRFNPIKGVDEPVPMSELGAEIQRRKEDVESAKAEKQLGRQKELYKFQQEESGKRQIATKWAEQEAKNAYMAGQLKMSDADKTEVRGLTDELKGYRKQMTGDIETDSSINEKMAPKQGRIDEILNKYRSPEERVDVSAKLPSKEVTTLNAMIEDNMEQGSKGGTNWKMFGRPGDEIVKERAPKDIQTAFNVDSNDARKLALKKWQDGLLSGDYLPDGSSLSYKARSGNVYTDLAGKQFMMVGNKKIYR